MRKINEHGFMRGKQGKLPTWAILVLVLVPTLLIVSVFGYWAFASTVAREEVVVDYDGEFDDAYLADKGDFYSDFTEGTDCNVTSDVLGGSGYTSCIYDTATDMDSVTYNSTEYRLDLVLDIDGPVEDMEIEGELQNTGTGQAKDDITIIEVEIWTYEDATETELIYTVPVDNEDGDFEGETGALVGDEYVFHIIMKTKLISPDFADGDDIMKIQFDLTTDGDVDAARILLEE